MIRRAELKDLSRINDIYNQAISMKFQTADSIKYDLNDRLTWFKNHDSNEYPVLVYLEKEQVIGWATISKYRNGREALRNTVEVSYYVDQHHQGTGIGTQLLSNSIDITRNLGYKNLIAMLLEPNVASIGLLTKFGFQEWGRIPGAAEIDGKQYDHLYYGLQISS